MQILYELVTVIRKFRQIATEIIGKAAVNVDLSARRPALFEAKYSHEKLVWNGCVIGILCLFDLHAQSCGMEVFLCPKH